MTKLSIVGASHFVGRMFEACGNYQWAREFLKNALEAEATKVEFGIEWQAVDREGVYRRTIADNGSGMAGSELHRFFSTLGEGAKKIGGVHDNFGVGAKIASLPWNPEGMVVLSYKDGAASMIWIQLDPDTAEYELLEFNVGGTMHSVIDPTQIQWDADINWAEVAPEWARQNGTTIVLLGSEEAPDTVLGNPNARESDIKGLSVYLNSRFWDLTHLEVTVVELRSAKQNLWPSGPDERADSRRPNNRKIMGAKHYLADITGKEGQLSGSGAVPLDQDRVQARWYLWEGTRPAIHSYARKPGYIAVKYKDELFELTDHKAHFRWFGIADAKVQQNLFIILEPQLYNPDHHRWGIHPDQSRHRLIFSGNGDKGVGIPMADWGAEFSDEMPDEIRAAILAARGETAGSLQDDEYRKRLQEKFGSRWTTPRMVRDEKADPDDATDAGSTDEMVQAGPGGETKRQKRSRRSKRARRINLTPLANPTENGAPSGEHDAAVDVPWYRYASKDNFEKPWHLALWDPHDPEGPTVLMNEECPFLLEAIKYHQAQYPDVHMEEIDRIVRDTYGEVAVCKIAHSQKLAKHISEQQVDQDYRTEAALTISLMGLLAEETLIGQRLQKLGRKKAA